METSKKLRTQEIIQLLIERDGDKCQMYFCTHPFDFSHEMDFRTIEHVIPRSKGGTDDMSNLVLAHFRCNNKRGDRDYLEDGTLEPLPFKEPKSQVKKRPPTPCCNEGRNLKEDEICQVCGLEPQPPRWPRWAKLESRDCDHNSTIFWCWACSMGLYERPAAYEDVFGTAEDFSG